MHLIETYAANSGSKIDKPYIYPSYFPHPYKRYISFHGKTKFQSKDYRFLQEVIDIIAPVLLKEGIHIFQTGGTDDPKMQGVVDIRGHTTVNQLAYVIQNSELHFGSDSFGIHLASGYNVPLVALYSVSQPEICGPYFGESENQILFKAYERKGNKKPSYSSHENEKCVDLIKPEEIANAIFTLLHKTGKTSVLHKSPYETVYIGEKYDHARIREVILKNPVQLAPGPCEIRYDLNPNDEVLPVQIAMSKGCAIITDKPLNLSHLVKLKQNINHVVYKITENDDPKFAAALKATGIPMMIASELSEEQLQKKKINYYDLCQISNIPKISPEEKAKILKNENLFYRSNKLVYEEDKGFFTWFDCKQNNPIVDASNFQAFVDDELLWKEFQYLHIVKKL